MRFFTFLVLVCFSFLIFAHGDKKHDETSEVTTLKRGSVASNVFKKINEKYLIEVKPIFKRSCFDCHSDQTDYPWYYRVPVIKELIDSDIKEAKKHLDFSNDFPFAGHGSPEKDLKSIKKAIQEGDMPLWSYEIMHPNSKLSAQEKKTIFDWIDRSIEELE